jgi:hypothetical protein
MATASKLPVAAQGERRAGRATVGDMIALLVGMTAAAALTVPAAEAQARRCWTFDNCAAKCRQVWGNQGGASVDMCIASIPCSQFPRRCGAEGRDRRRGK